MPMFRRSRPQSRTPNPQPSNRIACLARIVHRPRIPHRLDPGGSTLMFRSFAALSLLLVSTSALAAPARPAHDAAAWDVNAPPGAILRQVQLNVNEGTWMN